MSFRCHSLQINVTSLGLVRSFKVNSELSFICLGLFGRSRPTQN